VSKNKSISLNLSRTPLLPSGPDLPMTWPLTACTHYPESGSTSFDHALMFYFKLILIDGYAMALFIGSTL
jgi:hypothetical protein